MTVPIGFVLLLNPHAPLEQPKRLIETLTRMFGNPPIACHHDFGQNSTFLSDLPENVRMVRPHVATKWGDFSCVEAMIKALRLLYENKNGPDWFVYLSGADYPIKSAEKILADLNASAFDAHIEHRVVSEGDLIYLPDPENPQGWKGACLQPHNLHRLKRHKPETWLENCRRRYCSVRIDIPGINRYCKPSKRTYRLVHPFFTKGRLPFNTDFKCYAGEAWFSGNRRCAERIIDFYDKDRMVVEHYKKVATPEESYFQTILGNAPNLQLSQNFLRYIDWSRGGSNPKTLLAEDLSKLETSSAHFARKFDHGVDSSILDRLDEIILRS